MTQDKIWETVKQFILAQGYVLTAENEAMVKKIFELGFEIGYTSGVGIVQQLRGTPDDTDIKITAIINKKLLKEMSPKNEPTEEK